MKNPSLYSIKRQFEIVLAAYESLEELASGQRGECDASTIGQILIPLNFQAEEVLREINALYERGKRAEPPKADMPKLQIVAFPGRGTGEDATGKGENL